MREIKAPNKLIFNNKSIFLAGSIEMGRAIDWQTQVVNALKNEKVTILNPRRDDWDSSWEQIIGNKQFREQVEWELEAQEKANKIAMYIDPETKSPITLLELGLFAHTGKIVVCCPNGFYRKGNVDIVCYRYGIRQVNSLEELVGELKNNS